MRVNTATGQMGKEGGEDSSGLYRSGSFYTDGGKEVLVVTQLEVYPVPTCWLACFATQLVPLS